MTSHADKIALKWLVALPLAAILLSASVLVAVRLEGSPIFHIVAVITIVALCSLIEWLIPARSNQPIRMILYRGVGRGCCIGLAAWLVVMLAVSELIETGDKFQAYVVVLSPLAAGVGAVGGGIARVVSLRCRRFVT